MQYLDIACYATGALVLGMLIGAVIAKLMCALLDWLFDL